MLLSLQASAVALSGISLRFAGSIHSLRDLHCAATSNLELHCIAPIDRFDADAVYNPDTSKVTL